MNQLPNLIANRSSGGFMGMAVNSNFPKIAREILTKKPFIVIYTGNANIIRHGLRNRIRNRNQLNRAERILQEILKLKPEQTRPNVKYEMKAGPLARTNALGVVVANVPRKVPNVPRNANASRNIPAYIKNIINRSIQLNRNLKKSRYVLRPVDYQKLQRMLINAKRKEKYS